MTRNWKTIEAEHSVRAEGYAAGQRDERERNKFEVDAAYQRGFDDGVGGVGPGIIAGLVAGAGAATLFFLVFII